MALTRGSVVSLRRGGAGIVWKVDGGDLLIVPIGVANGTPRHRAEVRIEDLSDIVACGISVKYPAARCHQMFRVAIAKLKNPEPIGKAPFGLMGRLFLAVTRELYTQHAEQQLARCMREAGVAVA